MVDLHEVWLARREGLFWRFQGTQHFGLASNVTLH
jgi:hypothetical protein